MNWMGIFSYNVSRQFSFSVSCLFVSFAHFSPIVSVLFTLTCKLSSDIKEIGLLSRVLPTSLPHSGAGATVKRRDQASTVQPGGFTKFLHLERLRLSPLLPSRRDRVLTFAFTALQ